MSTTLNLLDDDLSNCLEQGGICLWQMDYLNNVTETLETRNAKAPDPPNGKILDANNAKMPLLSKQKLLDSLGDKSTPTSGTKIPTLTTAMVLSLFSHNGASFSMTTDEFLHEYCNPDEVAQIIARLQQAAINSTPFYIEHQIYNRKQHCWLWVYSSGAPKIMDNGCKRFYGCIHNIDKRKRHGLSLGTEPDSADRTNLMLDAMPLACTFWGETATPRDCNLEAMRMFACSNKQEYLSNFFKLSPELQPDGRNSRQAALNWIELARKTGFERFEWTHQSLNGTPIPAEITITSTNRPTGVSVISYVRDLRENTHALSTKEKDARRTSIMLNAMPLCCDFWDANYNRIDCSDEAVRIFGAASKEEYLQSFAAISPKYQPDGSKSLDSSCAKLAEAFKTGRAQFEWMHCDLQGNPIPAMVWLIRTEFDGKAILVSYILDLREIKATQVARGEADERTQIMLDSMPLCCNFWNKDFVNIDCNLEAMRLFELSSKQEYLARFSELSPEYQPNGRLSADCARENITEAFETGYKCFEWVHQKLNGELIPSEITLVRASHSSGPIVAGYTRDMREIKLAMDKILCTQNQLLEACEEAKQSASAKSEFLANMSHEIRTPMNAILGMLHLITKTELTAKQSDYLDKATYSATLLLRVINDILDFSKIEAGKMKMERIDFNIAQVPAEIHEMFSKQLDDKNITLNINIAPDVPKNINGDPVRLTQVLLNLVSNSIKFTPGGEISITIERESAAPGLVKLFFTVNDTGIGMTQKQVKLLFCPFSQADASTTRKYGGSGLGLAICSSLVEFMGGKIWCKSSPGAGSTFYFQAVFELPKGEAIGETAYLAKQTEDISPCLNGMKVLLAEDNEINQLIATELLSIMGVEVDVAVNGKEAIKAVQKKDYDLVLMDIQMPEMDGISATKKLRTDPRYASLPILAMTAHAMVGDKEHSLASGMNDHLTKPINPNKLYAALAKWGKTRDC